MRPAQVIIGVAASVCIAGCHRSAASLEWEQADRAAVEDARGRVLELEQALDEVEARIWSNRSTSRLYAELAERHRRVSALACRNAQMHSQSMSRRALQDRQGRADLALRRQAEVAKASTARPVGY